MGVGRDERDSSRLEDVEDMLPKQADKYTESVPMFCVMIIIIIIMIIMIMVIFKRLSLKSSKRVKRS